MDFFKYELKRIKLYSALGWSGDPIMHIHFSQCIRSPRKEIHDGWRCQSKIEAFTLFDFQQTASWLK